MDYAASLFGSPGEAQAAPPKTEKPKDYAADLMGSVTGGKEAEPSVMTKYEDLPLGNKDTNDNTAGFGTLVKAQTVDDPVTKLKIFAKDRFPKLSEKEALSRYGIIDGKVVYAGDDGKLYKEEPDGFTGFLKDTVGAGTVANALPLAGGAAGAVAGFGAGGPVPAVLGGMMGAEAGRGYTKVASNLIFDEPQTVSGNARDMLLEGAFEAGGNFVGAAVGKLLTKGAARDIRKLDLAGSSDIVNKSKALGVDLNPAQITNLPSLKGKFDVLASLPTSRDAIAEFSQKQSKQANDAAEKFLGKVSKVDDVDEAGSLARDGAKQVISKLTKERADAARPLYNKAFDETKGVPPEMIPRAEDLMRRPSMVQAGRIAVKLAKDEGVNLGDPKNSLLGMHYMKLALGDMIESTPEGGRVGPTRKRALTMLNQELVGMMDEISPTYKQARETFAHFSPNIVSVQDGIISKVAGLGDEQALEASKMVFSDGRSPASVERMRNLFVKSGLENDWNALLGAYLRETFSKAGQEFATSGGALNQAPKWRAILVGNPRQYRLMEKAMAPNQFRAFNDMMDVFDAISRTSGAGAGSQTMPRQEAAQMLRREAGAGVAGQMANVLSPQNFGARASNWLAEVRLGNHAEKLAEVMTSPDGMKRLKELKRLSPNDQRFIAGASALFGISLKPANQPADTAPGQ